MRRNIGWVLMMMLALGLASCAKDAGPTAPAPVDINADLRTSDGELVLGEGDTLSHYNTQYEGKDVPEDQAIILYKLGALEHMPGAAIIRRSDGSEEDAFVMGDGPLAGALVGYKRGETVMVRDGVHGQLARTFSPRTSEKLVSENEKIQYEGRDLTPMEAFVFSRLGWSAQ